MLSDIILKLPIKWKKVKFATVYREIENLMKNKEVKVEWYPSHAEKKLSEGGKNAEEVKNSICKHSNWSLTWSFFVMPPLLLVFHHLRQFVLL